MDGVWVTVTVVPKTVQVKTLTGAKRKFDALDKALTAAKLKNGRFSHQTGAGEPDDWHVLAKVVTHVFGANGGHANPETLPKLLHFFLIGLITAVCDPEDTGAESSIIAGDQGDGGEGGGEGGDKGSKGGGGGGGGVGGGGVGGGGDDKGSRSSDSSRGGSDGGKTTGQKASDANAPRILFRQNASSSWIDTENIDPQIGPLVAGSQVSKTDLEETQETTLELTWKADRDRILAAAQLAYGNQGGKLSDTRAAIIDTILIQYQLENCSIHSLLSVTVGRGGVLTVLCRYNGTNSYVAGDVGIMNPGGMFEVWISDLRVKSRWKNDTVFRHAVNWLSFYGRTKHSPEILSLVAPPLRLLKQRAFMGFASLDGPRQNNLSLGATFLAVKHEASSYKMAIRRDMSKRVESDALVLADDFRRGAQILCSETSQDPACFPRITRDRCRTRLREPQIIFIEQTRPDIGRMTV